MNRRNYTLTATLAAVLAGSFFCPQASAYLVPLGTDGKGEYNIAAVQTCVKLNNPRLNAAAGGGAGAGAQTVFAWVYWDPNTPALPSCLNTSTCAPNGDTPIATGIPIPVIKITAGTMVTINFQNRLPEMPLCHNNNNMEGVSIHWHGIELDNDSDGVSVTQDSLIGPGQTYTYRFIAPRPGVYWFHSHMVPGDTLWAGMMGILYVTDTCEANLIANNILPPSSSYPPPTNTMDSTFPLAMGDTEWDTISTHDTFGQVGRVDVNNLFKNGANMFYDINMWIEKCGANGGGGGPANVCGGAQFPGETVLVNGSNPDTMKSLVTWNVAAGQTIRLQLFNEALTRNFDLYVLDKNGTSYPLVRIGGQGGVLNYARIEGDSAANPNSGNEFGWKSFYDQGHISISSGTRADTVVCVPNNTNLGPLTVWAYNNTANWPLQKNTNAANGFKIPPAEAVNKQPVAKPGVNGVPANQSYPIAYFNIVTAPGNLTLTPCITSNTPLQAALGTNVCPLPMNLTNGGPVPPNGGLINPPPGSPGNPSPPNPIITLNNGGNTAPSIDGLVIVTNNFLDGNGGKGDFVNRVLKSGLMTDRYATVGSVLQLAVANANAGGTPAHPYHLHGFSMQPISMVDGAGEHLFNKNIPNYEFIDTIDVYAGQTYNFAVRLDDRQKFCDSTTTSPPNGAGPILQGCTTLAPGGALGRWLFHCHIANHGVLGMMGEIIVLANDTTPITVLQPPDTSTTGVDVLATAGQPSQIVADDFQVLGSPITNVVIWGSWLHDLVDPNTTFELKFWTDVPSVNGPPSRPGWQAWEMMFPPGTYTNFGYTFVSGGEWFYAPGITNIPAGDTQVYQYGFPIPLATAFYPYALNGTNWLSVTAYPANTNAYFGWKTSILGTGWNDDSAWSPQTWGPPWSELLYLPPHPYGFNLYPSNSMNQAFAITFASLGISNSTPMFNSARAAAQGPAVLSVSLSGGRATIEWTGGGTLQSASSPIGPWADIPGSLSPYLAPAASPQLFYRVRVPQ